MYDWAFCEHAAAMNLTDWSTINVQLFISHAAGASVHSGRELSDELTEPVAHHLRSLFVSPGTETIVLFLPCHAALLPNALVALAHTTLELALLSHQANLILLPSSQSMLPLLVLAASLDTNGLDWTCSLSHVHPTFLLACFRLED